MATTQALELRATRNQAHAEEKLLELGKLLRHIDQIERGMNDRIARVKASHEQQARPMNMQAERLFDELHAWAEENKDELLKGDSKTAKLATGMLVWRTSPKSVRVTKPEQVIERLKGLGLERFVRQAEEVNKQAVLDEPEAVEGVRGLKIVQSETFAAKPFGAELEKTKPVKTIKKRSQ